MAIITLSQNTPPQLLKKELIIRRLGSGKLAAVKKSFSTYRRERTVYWHVDTYSIYKEPSFHNGAYLDRIPIGMIGKL